MSGDDDDSCDGEKTRNIYILRDYSFFSFVKVNNLHEGEKKNLKFKKFFFEFKMKFVI